MTERLLKENYRDTSDKQASLTPVRLFSKLSKTASSSFCQEEWKDYQSSHKIVFGRGQIF